MDGNNFRFRMWSNQFKHQINSRGRPGHSICLLIFLYLSCLCRPSYSLQSRELYGDFYKFAVQHKRPYLTNSTEMQIRFEIFKDNVAQAKQLNKAYSSSHVPVYGVNKFADLSTKEFRATYLSHSKPSKKGNFRIHSFPRYGQSKSLEHFMLPKVVDWRKKKVVTPIKDQGTCGACWSYCTVETMESMFAIKHNATPPELSVQQMVDCDERNNGCEGGDICEASEWASQNGIVSASAYPATHHTDHCKPPPPSTKRLYVKSHSCSSFVGQEEKILQLLAEHGPVAVAIDASTWHNYVGGIIQYHCSALINHAVQLVGYDLTGDVPYYIVRNSWGEDFGDSGFLYIKYGADLCGLSTEVDSIDMK